MLTLLLLSLLLLNRLVSQDMMSSEQLQKLAELRKQRANAPQPSRNVVQVRPAFCKHMTVCHA